MLSYSMPCIGSVVAGVRDASKTTGALLFALKWFPYVAQAALLIAGYYKCLPFPAERSVGGELRKAFQRTIMLSSDTSLSATQLLRENRICSLWNVQTILGSWNVGWSRRWPRVKMVLPGA